MTGTSGSIIYYGNILENLKLNVLRAILFIKLGELLSAPSVHQATQTWLQVGNHRFHGHSDGGRNTNIRFHSLQARHCSRILAFLNLFSPCKQRYDTGTIYIFYTEKQTNKQTWNWVRQIKLICPGSHHLLVEELGFNSRVSRS